MKSYYLLKTLLPLILLPLAPGVLQVELAHLGVLTRGNAIGAIILEALLTLALLAWAMRLARHREAKAFLRMSCISKKVYFAGEWMSVERYLSEHHNVVVSHGFTPDELETWLSDAQRYVREEKASLRLAESAV